MAARGGGRGEAGGRRGGRGRGRRVEGEIDQDVIDASTDLVWGRRTAEGTVSGYKNKLLHMAEFFLRQESFSLLTEDRRSIQVPIEDEDMNKVLEFFGYLASPAYARRQLTSPDDITDEMAEPYSDSTIEGYRSALLSLYKNSRPVLVPSELISSSLTQFINSYKNVINDLRQKGLIKLTQGKKKLSLAAYSHLCEKFLKWDCRLVSTPTTCWAFVTICWNLMSRPDSVDSLMLCHLDWDNDHLVVEEQGHKGDQSGTMKYGKAVYANPLQPCICPVLALAVLCFSKPTASNWATYPLGYNKAVG
jgi:hypothetical protein